VRLTDSQQEGEADIGEIRNKAEEQHADHYSNHKAQAKPKSLFAPLTKTPRNTF
jgi:hypothetical protein